MCKKNIGYIHFPKITVGFLVDIRVAALLIVMIQLENVAAKSHNIWEILNNLMI
jgi:hypothetical protein